MLVHPKETLPVALPPTGWRSMTSWDITPAWRSATWHRTPWQVTSTRSGACWSWMGTGGEEPLQGAAGITQVRACSHHPDGETLYTRPLVLSLGASSGSWFGVACRGGGCTWDIGDWAPKSARVCEMGLPGKDLVVVVEAGVGVLDFLLTSGFGNRSRICPSWHVYIGTGAFSLWAVCINPLPRHFLDKSTVFNQAGGRRWGSWWSWEGLYFPHWPDSEAPAKAEEDGRGHAHHRLCDLWGK